MAPALALGCALISGVLLPLALAPFDIWPLAVLAPALLLAAVHGQSTRFAMLLGYVHGVGRYGLGVSWIYMSIHVYGPAPPWLAGTLVGLFVLAMAIFPALMTWLFARLSLTGRIAAGLAFCGLWVLLEWLLTWLLTGFPWLFVGYAHLESPLSGYAPVGGVLLVSLLSVFTGVGLWWLGPALRPGDRRWSGSVMPGGAALVLLWVLGAGLNAVSWTRPAGAPLNVALVQGVIPQDIKWQAENREAVLRRHLELSEPHWGADLLVWSEAAITWFARDASGLLEDLGEHARGHGTTFVTGIPDYQRDPGDPTRAFFQNTAIALGAGEGQYVKQRLVPFGEYVPLEDLLRGLISFFDLPMSHARPGPAGQAPLRAGSETLAMAICYEIVYPDLVRELARDATLLVTLSNDTWFGDSIGPEQHHQMARMRALELGRWLIRATNDGVTGLVDHKGVEQARLPRFEPDVLTGTVLPMTGKTPFAMTGSWPSVVLALLLVAVPWWRRTRRM
ncbi:MAG: apolipoprotein N-acyltransferase [Gammaproteobacteria bacterium]|nr:apolipoprotein N-acyltransferase [Gammaproteobacteria bacterium]